MSKVNKKLTSDMFKFDTEHKDTTGYISNADNCILTYIVIGIIVIGCLVCNIVSIIYLKNILNLLIKIAYG